MRLPNTEAGSSAHRNDLGAAAVEFALVSVLLLIVVVGMVAMGQAYAAKLAVTHAAREGARMAAVNKYDASYVRAQAAPLAPASVTVSKVEGMDSYGKYVQVTVDGRVDVWFLQADWSRRSGNIRVSSTARMKSEF